MQASHRLVLKLGIEINPKYNVLSWFKLLSRDSGSHIPYKIHMNMFPLSTTCDCKKYFETANYSRISQGVAMPMAKSRYLMPVMTM